MRQNLLSYATGALCIAVALGLNLLLGTIIKPHTTVLFLAAVAVTAWRGGIYPSLFATLLAVLAIDFFFQPPLYSFEFSFENTIDASIFVAVALLISWIDGERKRAVSERDFLLESERRARVAAEEANRAKDKFLAMVTHELRSPLNAILGWTQILKRQNLDQAQSSRAFEVIERSTKTQMRLVEDLLDISRITAGKFDIEPQPIDLRVVVDEAVESVAASIAAKRIRLHRETVEEIGLVSGDAERLRQAVWNLLSNAVKFTPEDGQIEIHLSRAGNHARLKIYDSGAGISPEFLPYVFDSFRQAGENGNRHGLGLGLAIVRHLVEAHGGIVSAHSAGINLGATFTVELPLLESRQTSATNTSVKPEVYAVIGEITDEK